MIYIFINIRTQLLQIINSARVKMGKCSQGRENMLSQARLHYMRTRYKQAHLICHYNRVLLIFLSISFRGSTLQRNAGAGRRPPIRPCLYLKINLI